MPIDKKKIHNMPGSEKMACEFENLVYRITNFLLGW